MSFAVAGAVITAGGGVAKIISGAKAKKEAEKKAEMYSIAVDMVESSK